MGSKTSSHETQTIENVPLAATDIKQMLVFLKNKKPLPHYSTLHEKSILADINNREFKCMNKKLLVTAIVHDVYGLQTEDVVEAFNVNAKDYIVFRASKDYREIKFNILDRFKKKMPKMDGRMIDFGSSCR